MGGYAQNVGSRTTEFEIDLSDPGKTVKSALPAINWITPVAETNFVSDAKYRIKFEIVSTTPLKNISIVIKETFDASSRGMLNIAPASEAEKFRNIIE
ncbi:MAG TPA: hypothetical protein DDZ56_10285, partial [Cytophagales bacterium]|nr:hypothetical protein [Cytophagales bacterium]